MVTGSLDMLRNMASKLLNVLYDDQAILDLKQHVESGKPVIFEGIRGTFIQNLYEAKVQFIQTITGRLQIQILSWWQEGKEVHQYISYYRDVAWNPDATESKKVRPKDLVAPTFSDKLGQIISKGDLVVASNRDGSLVIGQMNRVTPRGTVFLKTIGENQTEFKLYQTAKPGENNTGLLKLTDDLRTQIMLLKLST